jgi:uncharacterized protein
VSVSVDANILVYASNDIDPAHDVAASLMSRLAEGPDIVYLFWPTILGYLRIVTHPSILPHPLTPNDATANIQRLIERPHVRSVGESVDFWRLYVASGGQQSRGDAVPDMHLATLLRENGVRILYTRDRGFRRFEFLDVRDPFTHRISEEHP